MQPGDEYSGGIGMGAGKGTRQEELQHELVAELRSLRESVRETAEGFILRKEGEIEALIEYLLRMKLSALKAVAKPWMLEKRALKLKPAKGRIKDLKKIDTLLHDLLNHVMEADETEKKPKRAVKKGAVSKSRPLPMPEEA